MKLNRYYLGLGSNEKGRFWHIQSAIFELENDHVKVMACSGVYENEAKGFSGNPFYNACVAVDTELSAHQLLRLCLSIEEIHGRTRANSAQGYQNRPLDIDLLIGDESIDKPELILPHPRIYQRRFVLKPLIEVAELLQDTAHLSRIGLWIEQCQDNAELRLVETPLLCSVAELWKHSGLVVIEGCIGVGKTSLCKHLSARYSLKMHLERFESNPYLNQFYQDPKAYALPTELYFLADRHEALSNFHEKEGSIADYHLSKSELFARLNLTPQDFQLFSRFYDWSKQLTQPPALYVLLDAPVALLEKRIKMRGRSYETKIDPLYLERIRVAYQQLHLAIENSLLIDSSDLDFVHNPADFDAVCAQINRTLLRQRMIKYSLD